jgi:LacI family transcriptional regulator
MEKSTVLIKQIAQLLQLSPSTVSIVLNGRGDKLRISRKTQKLVLGAAKDLNYQPNIYARRLRRAGERDAGRIVAIFWNSRFTDDLGKFFKGASATIAKNSYSIEFMLHLFDEDRLGDLRDSMTSQKYNGIIVCAPSDSDLDFLCGTTLDVPLVLSNRSNSKYSGIYTDNFVTGGNCARLFAANGHKKVGIIGVSGKSSGSTIRRFGFMNECERLGIEVRDEWIAESPDYDITGGYQCAMRILGCAQAPTGLFILTDTQALGAAIALKERKVRVPEDMEILAYGNSDMFDIMSPKISSVAVSRELMAESAVNLLMTKIENNITEPISKILVPEYRFRDSFRVSEEIRSHVLGT